MTNSRISRALACAAILIVPVPALAAGQPIPLSPPPAPAQPAVPETQPAAGPTAAPATRPTGLPPGVKPLVPPPGAVPVAPTAAPPKPLSKTPPPLMPDQPEENGGPASKIKPSVEVNTLQAPDPESVGVLEKGAGGFGIDMWAGTSRATVKRLLPQLPVKAPSPVMHDLMRRLLLSTATAPAGPAGTPSLISLRIERLAAMADAKGVGDLLDAAAARKTDDPLARARVNSQFLSGDVKGACGEADEMIHNDATPFWQKAFAFCQILAQQNEKARLSISLLRDTESEKDPAFFTIAHTLLGEKPKKADRKKADAMGGLSPLEIAMLRSAHLPLPADVADSADPAVLQAIAAYPDADENIRLAAAEHAEAVGVLSPENLAKIYAGVSFKPQELDNALSQAQEDPGPRGRALLYQAAAKQTVPTARAEVLQAAWKLARENGAFETSARVNAPLVADMAPASELMWFAADAGRALFVAGDNADALKWYDLAASAAARDSEAKKAQAALWPVAALADTGNDVAVDAAAVRSWLQASKEIGADGWQDRAAYALALLDALGVPVDPSDWGEIITNTRVAAETPGLALWTALRDAGNDKRIGLTVLLSMLALGEKGPAGASPIVAESVVANLDRVGLADDARRIAVEAAIGAGL